MTENCATVEPWPHYAAAFRSAPWISEASSARETEAMTNALQISLSFDSSASSVAISPNLLSFDPVEPEPGSDPAPGPRRAGNPVPSSSGAGKIKKRKSRAKKRCTTIFITTDPANFRKTVQQVTGIRLRPDEPQPQRPTGESSLFLPTLDTSSSFLLDRDAPAGRSYESFGSLEPGTEEGPAFDLGPLPSYFPTLESWSVM